MAVVNLESEYVTIFPCAKPRVVNEGSNRLYERNMSASIRQLYPDGIQGFVINPEGVECTLLEGGKALQLEKDLEFSLGGYYCKLSSGSSIQLGQQYSDVTRIEAVLLLSSDTQEIAGQDDGVVYKGLHIWCNSGGSLDGELEVTGNQVLSLCLLSRENTSMPFSVPSESVYNALKGLSGIDGRRRNISTYG